MVIRKSRDDDAPPQPAARLGRYRAKRDFSATPEPAPAEDATAEGAPRFVIHEHHARRLHWDLRLERDGVLASWAIPKGLPEEPGENRFAAATEDHPLEYVDFAGEIPAEQYGAGKIAIWDHGTYECLKWEARKVEVALHGERVRARYALFAIDKEDPPKNWMIHRMDPAEDRAREPMPRRIVPMLARPGALPAEDGRWAFEIKWDGVRAIAYSRPGELRLESRNLNDITHKYPELARIDRSLGSHSAVLDGEIVAFDETGRPSFSALQQRMQLTTREQARRQMKSRPITYVIFDLLWLDGHSLMQRPYSERRARLRELGLSGESWQTPEHHVGEGEALLRAVSEQRLEGVIAKRLDSTYRPGQRTPSWIKIKTLARQELVIGGWVPGQGKRRARVGALLLGVHDGAGGPLLYAGRVGSGFSESELDRLQALLAPLERSGSPFAPAQTKPPRGAVFCEPTLVAEVEFSDWTTEGSLRHPVYKGLREDKAAAEVVREPVTRAAQPTRKAAAGPDDASPLLIHELNEKSAETSVDGRELKLSNLAKVLYPSSGFAKRELIDYYATLAPVLLGHLAGRALTVTRWPDGVEGKSFFQKQAPAHRPEWVRTAAIASASKSIDYTLADDLPTLVWLANLAAIELHTPLALAAAPERPTVLVFDLDPGAPATILECCQVALLLQGMFEQLSLECFAKTSGSKGLQVYVPLNSGVSFTDTKSFAKTVAELLEGAQPELVVSRMTKAHRAGKVLIDWSRNDAKKTTVCVYSLRATERPGASTPVAWDEVRATLDGGDPASLAFEAAQVLERVAEHGDLFAPVLSLVQQLPASS
jgi:bifunctional non-homologous end joining protein LigD